MQTRQLPSAKDESLQTVSLKRLIDGWILEFEIRQCSPRTVESIDRDPNPEVSARVKVNLRTLAIEIFDYSGWAERPRLNVDLSRLRDNFGKAGSPAGIRQAT